MVNKFNYFLGMGVTFLPEQWTGDLVGRMHNHKILYAELADKLGLSVPYISMVLNGSRSPRGAEERFNAALDELISEKEAT